LKCELCKKNINKEHEQLYSALLHDNNNLAVNFDKKEKVIKGVFCSENCMKSSVDLREIYNKKTNNKYPYITYNLMKFSELDIPMVLYIHGSMIPCNG